MLPTKKKLSFSRSLSYIVASILIFSGIPTLINSSYRFHQESKKADPKYMLTELVQTGPVKEAIKSEHLEEILDLSIEKQENIYCYDLKKAEKLLMQSGVIRQANLSIEPPNKLVIDYIARDPIAYVGDYSNLVVDLHGVIFPLTPYYTPKILPQIYLGMQIKPFSYGKIEDKKFEIAKDILTFFNSLNLKNEKIIKIDVSHLRDTSVGLQEIIVTLSQRLGTEEYLRYLRLSPHQYLEEIEHYFSLKQMCMAQHLVVDLRLLPNAYLTPIE